MWQVGRVYGGKWLTRIQSRSESRLKSIDMMGYRWNQMISPMPSRNNCRNWQPPPDNYATSSTPEAPVEFKSRTLANLWSYESYYPLFCILLTPQLLYNLTSLTPSLFSSFLEFLSLTSGTSTLSLWTFVYWGMPADISADVAYLGGVWAEGVLYGTFFFSSMFLLLIMTWHSRYPVSLISHQHSQQTNWSMYTIAASSIIIFFTLCYIFTSNAYTRGREKSSK